MKNEIKLSGIAALIVTIGLLMLACPQEPGGSNHSDGPFTISGSFAAQAGSGDAIFFATESAGSSQSVNYRSAARSAVPNEIALEGLLEDGDITFRLRGSYNSVTKVYMLTAASSFFRYSISGDLFNPNDSKAVVQIKNGNEWTHIELSVSVSTSGEGSEIEADVNNIEDDFANGIPEEMWGIWWGFNSFERSKGDIIQSGYYYYVIDAFTIVEYTDRFGKWNREGYTCFFEGANVDLLGVVSGIVRFDYTDYAKIDEYDQTHGSWWVNCIADYVMEPGIVDGGQDARDRILAVLDNDNQGWQLWSNSDWTSFMNGWAAKSEISGFTGDRWTQIFAQPDSEYFYQQYKKDAFRIENGQLQMGSYYEGANSNIYFSRQPEGVENFNDLRWGGKFTRDRDEAYGTLPTSKIVTGKLTNGLTVPDELTAVMHNNFEGKNEVLQVLSGFHWSVLEYRLDDFKGGQEVSFSVSMDVWLKTSARVAWQINQNKYLTQDAFPLVAGNMEDVYEAGQWHTITGTGSFNVGTERSLYLSTMQILITDSEINAIPSLVENEIYIANVTITAVGGAGGLPEPIPVNSGNLGNYIFGDKGDGSNDYNQAVWGLYGEKLGMAQEDDSVLVLEFTEEPFLIDLVWGADPEWWNLINIISGGEITRSGVTLSQDKKTLTINLKDALVNFNEFKNATVYANLIIADWMAVNINGLGIISAELSSDSYVPPLVINLGNYTWADIDHVRGWNTENETRAKIADGTIKYFVMGLDAASVQNAGGLNSINIIFNYNTDGIQADNSAFPWNWDSQTNSGGWISYDDLIKHHNEGGYGAHLSNEGVLYLQYDLRDHPDYNNFKTAITAASFAEFGIQVHVGETGTPAWENGAEWHPVVEAFFKEAD